MSKYTTIGLSLGLLVFVTSVVLGCVYSFAQPTIYESRARVWVQPKLAEMVPSSYQSSLYAPLTAFFNSPITTAGEVLRSDVVLAEAHSRLAKKLPTADVPGIEDLRGITVTAVANADILVLYYRNRDPKICKLVLDSILDSFIDVNSAQAAQSARQSRLYLEQQLSYLRKQELEARQKMKSFQQENDSVNLGEETNDLLRSISTLKDRIALAQQSVTESRTRVAFLQSQLKISPEDAIVAQRLSADDEVKELKLKLAQQEVQLIDLKTKLRPNHPRLAQLKVMIDKNRNALRERVSALVGDTDMGNIDKRFYATDPLQQKMLSVMIDARTDDIAKESALSGLRQALEAQQAKLESVPDRQLRLAELQRAQTVSAQTLSDAERNLQSVKLLESVAAKSSNIQILDRPQVPGAPLQSKTSFGILIATALGLVLGAAAFAGVFFLNPAVQRVKQAVDLLPLPIIGWIEQSPAREGFRDILPGMQRLRLNIRLWLAGGKPTIVVTSGDPGDGKSLISSALAMSLAQTGHKVAVIDANFHHPSIHELFAARLTPGLCEYLTGENFAEAATGLQKVQNNLWMLPAGQGSSASMLLDSSRFEALLRSIHQTADVVIIDTPAASESSDSMAVVTASTFVIVVIRLKHTFAESIRLLSAHLRNQEIAGGGLVFFGADEKALVAVLGEQRSIEEPAAAEVETPVGESSRW